MLDSSRRSAKTITSSRGSHPPLLLADQLVPNSQEFGNALTYPSINPELPRRTALPAELEE